MIVLRQNYLALYLHVPRRLGSSTTTIVMKDNLPTTAYKPEIVEKDKYKKWEDQCLFTAESEINTAKQSFSMVLPPPNVTGKLHLGHALACTIQDVIVRRKRSMGENVLWLPGTDHAGIATQGVVEKHLKSVKNQTRHEIGRDKFVKEVWKWRLKHGDTICQQLRTLGCSLDWSRQRFTMDRTHCRAVETAFIQLFQRGLVTRKTRLVNWCCALKSTVADIEVDSITVDGPTYIRIPTYSAPVRFGQLFEFAYKVVERDQEVVVATTMPETMLGDTAVAVHPEDDRYIDLIGKHLHHPFRKEAIPIISNKFVDMEFGTGAVKITPAHSKIDYEVAQKHNLPLLQVINEDEVMINSGTFNNISRYECRRDIVQALAKLDLMRKVSPHKMTIPICSRSGDVISLLPKEQWFLSCTELNKQVEDFVKEGKLKILPEKFVKNWSDWTKEDRDWCISRQLWWGHQIPAYKCTGGTETVWVAAANEKDARHEACKLLSYEEDMTVERDTDVLDTWFSSGIYPFAVLGWPENTKDYENYYPLSLMATGHDILGFWVHRMVMLGQELTGRLPFENVLLHGVICDDKGAKMSKSKGNVIDPIDVIKGISLKGLKEKSEDMFKSGILSQDELDKALAYHNSNFHSANGIPECGVDALRFTLLSQDIKSHYVNFDVAICHSNKLFCNKIWQSVKYIQLSYAKLNPRFKDYITRNDLTFFDKWILSRLADMVERVNLNMDDYDFHLATKAIRTLIYNEFCDVYLESTKPGFDSGTSIVGYAHAHTLSAVLNTALRCLAPYMVYITEEIIPKIPSFENNIIHNFKDGNRPHFEFPKKEDFESWKDNKIEKKVEKVLSSVYLVRELKGLYNISNKLRPNILISSTDDDFIDDVENNKHVILNLTRCSGLKFGTDDRKYVNCVLDGKTDIGVEIVGNDADNMILAARNKLQKRIKKLEDTLARMEGKLSNNKYLESTTEWTQLKEIEKMLTKRKELEQLQRLI